jgi:cob(I)alamin adenosyltransferase
MLYTRKGDAGTTKTYGCDQRVSKSSAIAEALGSLDEINSFLGLVKVEAKSLKGKVPGSTMKFQAFIHSVQETLFIVQAEVAGFPKPLPEGKVQELEKVIDTIEKNLPPIKTFFISGGTKMAALFDITRTIARRAERRVVQVSEEGTAKVSKETLAFLNRLSSLLYALARLSNHKSGIKETPPSYK